VYRLLTALCGALLLLVLTGGPISGGAACAQQADDPAAAALISDAARFHPAVAAHGMAATQEAIASKVGAEILRKGGNAVDAGVAIGFALAVTHPQAGNLGGGGFMLIALAKEKRAIALDFRETAPAAASREMFLGPDGNVDTEKARLSRLSAGVPGTVKGLVHAQEKYGTMPLEDVMEPAIRLAEGGFPVSFAFAQSLVSGRERLSRDISSMAYFFHKDGSAYKPGEILRQPDLARTLRAISSKGADGFYKGWAARRIVEEMQEGGGLITLEDLRNYKVVERAPVRGTYRGYEIVSMPPPSSGGVHLIELLNILEGYDLKAAGPDTADYDHRLIEAMRRVYADRAGRLGDPDFLQVPVASLMDKAYAARLRASIDLTHASKSADIAPGKQLPRESEQTTHFSVMDKDGNAVSSTYTLNFAFGSGFSVNGAGFLLNNEMDDFSAKTGASNAYGLIGSEANAIQPGKRPLSSMTPVILYENGAPILATGSPGGSTIITVVLQVLLNKMEFGMNVAEATAQPRIHHQWMPDLVIAEPGVPSDTLHLLEQRGFQFSKDANGQVKRRILGRANTVMRHNGLFFGAADQRDAAAAVAGY
jgi:gamma-glutamyltranspeptidase/glutathione hydrolase